jgi:hypothetical protein
LPAGAEKIDGSGLTLAPGLVDLAVQAQPSMDLDVDYFYALSLAHGVTTIRTVDARLVWAVEQRERVRTGAVVGPRLVTSGPLIDSRGADPGPDRCRRSAGDRRRHGAAIAEVTRQRAVAPTGRASVRGWCRPVAAGVVRWKSACGRCAWRRVDGPVIIGVSAIDSLGPPVSRGSMRIHGLERRTRIPQRFDVAWRPLGRGAADAVQPGRPAQTPVCRCRIAATACHTGDEGWLRRERRPPRPRGADRAPRSRSTAAVARRRRRRHAAHVRGRAAAGGQVGTASGASAADGPSWLRLQREMMLLVQAGLTPAGAIRATLYAEVLGEGRHDNRMPRDLVGVPGRSACRHRRASSVAFCVTAGG